MSTPLEAAMRALILGSVLLSGSASAAGFNLSEVPATLDFQFNWTSHGVMGNGDFYFTTATPFSNPQCNQIAAGTGETWCFNGSFSTFNSGTGTYTTQSRRESCSEQTFFLVLGFVKIQTCTVRQRLRALYDVTNALYDGTSDLGTASRTKAWFIWNPEPAYPTTYTYDLSNPGLFSGTLSGPGTGTFVEL